MFHFLVDYTEPICKEIEPFLSSILISDTTGFEAYVKENNPKFFNSILRNSRKMAKASSANNDIKLAHLNGYFGYYIKANIITNGLGVVRHIDFYDKPNSFASNDSPDLLKDQYDSKTLIPVLENYFSFHPEFSYDYFLGDSGFDAHDNYRYLYTDKDMIPIISLNPRNKTTLPEAGSNELGIPTCPFDSSLEMKYDGISREKGRSIRLKWMCPRCKKTKVNKKTAYILSCENPCTTSACGRMIHTYVKNDYRLNCEIPRNSVKWANFYKIRPVIERTIAQLKSFISINTTKLQNTIKIKSNILIACISQLIAVILLYRYKSDCGPLAIKSVA